MKLRIAHLGLALSICGILLATLHSSGSDLPDGWNWSLTSGEDALAELIQNLILFIPLGASLALAGVPLLTAVGIGAGLSLSVEFAQQWIGGRDPSVGDLVSNSISTALGVGLVRLAPRWLLTSSKRSAWQALGAAIVAVLVWFATAALLRPMFPPPPYLVVRAPVFHHWGEYQGQVLSAELERGILVVKAVAPVRPPGRTSPLAAIFGRQNWIRATILAVDEHDLSLRYHVRATRIALSQPDLRWRGALAQIAPRDTFTASTGRDQGHVCLALNADWRCDLGYTIGDGWRLIFDPEGWPGWILAVINAWWVAGCVIGVGFWAARTAGEKATVQDGTGTTVQDGTGRYRTVMAKAAVAIALLGLILVPATTELNATRLVEWIGALLGIELGLTLGSWSRNDPVHRPGQLHDI